MLLLFSGFVPKAFLPPLAAWFSTLVLQGPPPLLDITVRFFPGSLSGFLHCSWCARLPCSLSYHSLHVLPSYDRPFCSDCIGCSSFWWIHVVALAEQGQGWTFIAKIIHCERWWQWTPSPLVSHPQVTSGLCIPPALIPVMAFPTARLWCLLCMLYARAVVSPHPFLSCTPMTGRKQKSSPPRGRD